MFAAAKFFRAHLLSLAKEIAYHFVGHYNREEMKKKRKVEPYIIAIFIFSLFVFVLSFPMKLSSGRTCLLHQIVCSDAQCEMETIGMTDNCNQKMIHRYLKPFAFIWWTSLLGLWYSLRRLTTKIN
ncbi:hypothetical protein B6D60_07090 [candidate division KSB1 bacterium 4484_87]|nr:MAG: hypothetical protein B6D60_07090 [candidate division KSB1 bacterium 4484_87]